MTTPNGFCGAAAALPCQAKTASALPRHAIGASSQTRQRRGRSVRLFMTPPLFAQPIRRSSKKCANRRSLYLQIARGEKGLGLPDELERTARTSGDLGAGPLHNLTHTHI